MQKLEYKIDNTGDCRFLHISDISTYDDRENVTNLYLEIKPPGAECFTTFHWYPCFKEKLSCSDLGICCVGCTDELNNLPDGNYEINISITPNQTTLTQYNYFRVCQLNNNYIKKLLSYFANKCNYSRMEKKCKQEELLSIDQLIKASVYMAEDHLDVDKAIELYNEAANKIKNFDDKDNCAC